MKRMMLRVAGLMVLFGALSVATAQADTRFSFHVGVGAPVVVAPRPYGYLRRACSVSRLRMAARLLRRVSVGAWRGSARTLASPQLPLRSPRLAP
jgi:hypothetical protein